MGKAAAARKLASAAAYGGGGLSLLGAGLYGVLRSEATLTRRLIGEPPDNSTPDSTGWYGRGRPGPAIKVALLGDSSAAGYGVDRIVETPGAYLASGIAAGANRRGRPRARGAATRAKRTVPTLCAKRVMLSPSAVATLYKPAPAGPTTAPTRRRSARALTYPARFPK